ncbi:Phosphoribosyltransferase [Syntrophobacter sp. SbD1]|nr:Phosphoribosyltransferase [Syntrophobacter sp. SbD1]
MADQPANYGSALGNLIVWLRQVVRATGNLKPATPKAKFILASISSGLKFAGSGLIDLFLPVRCSGCQKVATGPQRSWCRSCWSQIPWIASPLCPKCGRPFRDSGGASDYLCGECIESVFHFDSARSAVFHEGIVRSGIHRFKFGAQLEWTPSLVELLETTYAGWGLPAPDFIVPVPLHPSRLRQRGFNQSALLAGEFARKAGLPVSFNVIARKDQTLPQTRLKREERLKNVKGAFEISDSKMVRGRRILLVDDVFTTGTTLSECARTLKKKGGASEVHALTVTRALPG